MCPVSLLRVSEQRRQGGTNEYADDANVGLHSRRVTEPRRRFNGLDRLARVPHSRTDWRLIRQPSFLNSLGELHLHNRAARVTLYRSAHQGEEPERLYELDTTELAQG